MKLSTECLEASQVDSLLLGNLTPEEYEAAQDHLEMCETCRARVEATIGPEQWWSDVQSVLLNARTEAVAQRNAVSTDAETNEPSTAKLLDLLGPTDDPNMLGRIGPYEIIGVLGQGGMGAVFKGFDRSLNRFVAIKMLLPHLAASGAARKRFAREGQAVAAVVDDHVMAIHCVDEWQGVPYLVMTYSRGVSLQKRLSDNGPLEVREILRIGMQAAKGLAAAHAQGIVHRDIKPANIFLDQNVERVQLMDFGLARAVDDASLTRSGTLAGTPQYMSPEQARAETVDHRSDLFSLGSVMYAMCTGHAPFRAESSYSVLRLITDKEPRPIREINSDIPEWLCTIISKLMAKHANDRFGSAQEVAQLLEDCLAHVQQPTVKGLPGSLIQHLLPNSGSTNQAELTQRSKRFGKRAWLLAGISVTAIMLIAMILQESGPQRKGQGDSGPLTGAHANLGELQQQQKAREDSVRQISYHGIVRQYARQDIQRTNTESVDEFVARCLGLAPVYDDFSPYPLSASRDFSRGVYRFTMGDIKAGIPEDIKYMDWFIEKGKYVQLMGREPGACEAVVTNNREDIRDDREASLVRLDIAAFRPVKDILLSEVLKKAISEPGIPDVGGRPLWKLEKLDNNKVGWKATFMFQQPIAKPPGAKQILWYRVYWESIGGELVIVRVDKLTVDGDEKSTPQSVTLIDDYRSVCGKPVPFRVRCFVLGDSFVQGAELTVSDLKVNDYVDVPDQMQIPAGSSVRNQITGVKSRQPASKISDPTTDAELIQGTWNVLELQQVGYEASEAERNIYKNGGYKITFTKNKTIHSPDHSSMDYRVDTTQTPHVLELLQAGKVIAKAIYELTGDDLKMCQGRTPTDGSDPEPPTSFDINQAPTKFPSLYILRRTKPIEPVAIPNDLEKNQAKGASDCAVVMVMHPAELRNGNTIQRAAATKTVELLTNNDYCDILRYGSGKPETNWLWSDGTELRKIGQDREKLLAAIAESFTGDFPSLEPAFKMALEAFQKVNAKQRLMIVFTDGDPLFVDATLIDRFREAGIKVSVIHVDIHRIKDRPLLKRLVEATGGTYHYALESQATVVESLFVKEVQSLRSNSNAALQKIAVAFHMIHDKVGSFPGSHMKHLDRQSNEFAHPYSWRVAILPFIGQQQLFEKYRFDEPWDSDNNVALLKEMPNLYRSPHAPADQPPGNSNMLGIATESGGLGLNGGEAISSFTDGTSNTILIVETAHSVPWIKPEDLTDSKVEPIVGLPLRFVLADGSVGEMNPIDAGKLEKMITRNGGEVIGMAPVDNPKAAEQPALGKTLQHLQGKWRLSRQIAPDGDESSIPSQSEWEFKGDRYIIRDGGPGGAGLIEVDDSQSPAHVKMTIEIDEVSGLGLMSVEGDKANFCMGKLQKTPEPSSRPEKLQWVAGVYYMELTRMKPGEVVVPLKPAVVLPMAETVSNPLPNESQAPEIDHRNARSVVEAYVASALAGDVAKAAALAKNSPADPKRIRELPEFLNVQRLKIETVYVNDPAKSTRALATSVVVKLDEDHKQPNGQRDGLMVFTLELTDDKWFVIDIDFESESGAEKVLKRFLEANPNSIGLPPLMSSSMPNRNRAADAADDHDRLQGAWQSLNSKELPVMPGGRNQFSVSFLTDRMSMSAPQRAGIGTFSLSPDTVPKQIDCRLTFAEKQLEFIGIYEFHDDQLWLCLTEGEERPKSFDNPPTLARLMNFSLERKRVKLPEVDSNASLALSDWSQSQIGAGVFATYTLSIPGIETISQGLAAGAPAVKEFSGVPGFPGKVFTLRYFLPNLSPRGMAFVAGTSFQSSLDLIELAQVAEHKRLVKVFSYPDTATGASEPIGAVPVDPPVETPEVEPMESNLTISVLKSGANQAEWLKEIDATGEIIYGYEVVVQNANVSAPRAGDAAKAAPAESPLLVEARKALQACQNSLSWKQKFDMRVTNSYVHSQVGKVTIESRVRRDAPRMVESSLQTFDDQPKDHIRLDNWRLDDGEMFISRTTTVGQKKLTGLMTIKGRQKASWRMFESSSSFAMEGHFPGNQGRTLMELLMESKEPDVRMEKIGGHDCLRISARNDWGTMTVWIDAGPARRLRQCESFKERGNRFADGRVGEDKDTANLESFSYFVEDIQYKVIDGIEIAVSCRLRSTSIPNGGAKQEASTEYRRTEIHLRPDFAINNPFVGDFDDGARINDGDAFDRDAAFRWQDGKLTVPRTKPSIADESKAQR